LCCCEQKLHKTCVHAVQSVLIVRKIHLSVYHLQPQQVYRRQKWNNNHLSTIAYNMIIYNICVKCIEVVLCDVQWRGEVKYFIGEFIVWIVIIYIINTIFRWSYSLVQQFLTKSGRYSPTHPSLIGIVRKPLFKVAVNTPQRNVRMKKTVRRQQVSMVDGYRNSDFDISRRVKRAYNMRRAGVPFFCPWQEGLILFNAPPYGLSSGWYALTNRRNLSATVKYAVYSRAKCVYAAGGVVGQLLLRLCHCRRIYVYPAQCKIKECPTQSIQYIGTRLYFV